MAETMEISSSLTLHLSFTPPRLPSRLPFCASRSTFTSTSSLARCNRIDCSVRRDSFVIGISRSRDSRARRGLTCNALFGLGLPELVVIAGVAALVFGPKKLPEVGRSIGKTVKSFEQVSWILSGSARLLRNPSLFVLLCQYL